MAAKKKSIELPRPKLTAYQVQQVISLIESTRQRLKDADPEIEKDEALFRDMLDGESDVIDTMREFGRAYCEKIAYAEATHERVLDLQEREARFKRQAEAIKGAMFAMLQAAGLPSLPDTDFTAYTQAGREKLAEDLEEHLEELPDIYIRTEKKLNKELITQHLKQGIEIPHAALNNAPDVFVIKRK